MPPGLYAAITQRGFHAPADHRQMVEGTLATRYNEQAAVYRGGLVLAACPWKIRLGRRYRRAAFRRFARGCPTAAGDTHLAGMLSGLDIHYDLGEGHPLLGRRMPDLDLVTANGPLRVFALLHDARPVLLNLGEPGGFDITPWADRVRLIDAEYAGMWELPVLGAVTAPAAVLIRPDGYVAWVGDLTQLGLADALTTWFGPPAAA
jgi:hypothetical protein